MKSDLKLTVILSAVVIVLTFLSHAVDKLSLDLEVLDFALTIPMVVLAISVPAILAYRKRKKWALLVLLYVGIGTPMSVATAIWAMNLGNLTVDGFLGNFLFLIPICYGVMSILSLILVGGTLLFKRLFKRRTKAVESKEGSNYEEFGNSVNTKQVSTSN